MSVCNMLFFAIIGFSAIPSSDALEEADPAKCSSHTKCAAAGLTGECCPSEDGKMLDCCDAECSKHDKCKDLTGFCCPTTNKVMLECCSGNTSMSGVDLPSVESAITNVLAGNAKDPTSCASHSKCVAAGLAGSCCPSTDGTMLDCCEAECSKHEKCQDLTGFCCPSTDKVMLECCNGNSTMSVALPGADSPLDLNAKDPISCSSHSKCVAAGLEGSCCPSKDGKMLDCCEAECSKHEKCSDLTGFCCPTSDKVMLDCCDGGSGVSMIKSPLTTSETILSV